MTIPPLAARFGRPWITVPSRRLTLAAAPVLGGAVAVTLGLVVLVGWTLNANVLKAVVPGGLTVKPNTAVCFVLLGLGVGLLSRAGSPTRSRSVGTVLVGAATLLAALTGAQYLSGVDLGIDQLLFREPAGEYMTTVAGRMSPVTAACFTLLGLAALLPARAPRVAAVLSAGALATSVLYVFTFVFGADVPSFLAAYTPMALPTAVAMGILSASVIGLLGRANPFALFAGRSPTAAVWRRVLIASIAVPVVMAWLRLQGERLGLYDTTYGTSLMLVGILAAGIMAIVRAGRWAGELDARRSASEIERERFFELSGDLLSVMGADGRFRRVNRAWESVLGYPADDIVGRHFLDFVHPSDVDRSAAATRRHHEVGEPIEAFENRYRHRDGTYRWLEWTSQTAPDGSVAFAVARDITERKRAEDRLARRHRDLEARNADLSERTVRDALTGLHNRRFFDAEVARMERRWSRLPAGQRPPVSVIIFDLDHFGQVNKQHGHQAGDAVLRLFAGLLTERFRDQDLVARYGGEEFVAVLEGTVATTATQIADDLRAAFEAASVDIGTDTPIRVTVSAGCAQLGRDGNTSTGLAQADVGLSQAKRSGRNRVVGP